MCGIAGLFHTDGAPVSSVILKKMTDAIAHRGPDGEGHFVDGGLGLGHRRLSIIDLSSAGHQPMASEDGRYVIAYNGEVYNFNELRIELEAAGHRFHSRTDSEVVLKALAAWGSKALLRFNGMFALALWDKRERRLLLARDRYGIKPLYYACIGSSVVFGSEVKAILASGECRGANEQGRASGIHDFPEFLHRSNAF
jgi:asparagine synthase (glutamine-hydrolysing)